MKRIFILLTCLYSLSAFASQPYNNCGKAVPDDHPLFCSQFSQIAMCHCKQGPIPKACRDMDSIYKTMLAVFKSQDRACRLQTDTDYQTCMDDWNCYRNGGRDSQGRLCSSTGNKC